MESHKLFELEKLVRRPDDNASDAERALHAVHNELVKKYNRLFTEHMRSRG